MKNQSCYKFRPIKKHEYDMPVKPRYEGETDSMKIIINKLGRKNQREIEKKKSDKNFGSS